MRRYIRHHTDIPIEYLEYTFTDTEKYRKGQLKDISQGGFRITVSSYIRPGTRILFLFPTSIPRVEVNGIITNYYHNSLYGYELGVKFMDTSMEVRNRLIKQIRHIEEYRQEILIKEGRKLSGEEAVKEWSEKIQEIPRPKVN